MDGPTAQIVALTCHGNAFLLGTDAGEFFPENSTCGFCDRVSFVTLEKSFLGKRKEKEVAKTPQEWFTLIKSARATGIRLSRTPQDDPHISDRMSAGFVGGGGTWSMEVLLRENRSDFWIARWEVWNHDAPDDRIWRVTYGRIAEGATVKAEPGDLQSTAARLTEALREIHSFSAKHDCGGFTRCFADALGALESGGTSPRGYHKDLAPDGHLSEPARTLLDACQEAWVFGGMGSWNDMGFVGEDEKEYQRVSEQLFQTLDQAICDAANESCHKPKQRTEGNARDGAP